MFSLVTLLNYYNSIREHKHFNRLYFELSVINKLQNDILLLER